MTRRRGRRRLGPAAAVTVLLVLACAGPGDGREEAAELPEAPGAGAPPLRLTARVVRAYPHDPGAFTQGLVWHDGFLYESTGGWGESEVRQVELESGVVRQSRPLASSRFGEGLERVGERLVQLTWRAGEAIVYDLASLEPRELLGYRGEGWGLCFDGERLVRSDGTDRLTFHDPRSFAELDSVRVSRDGRPETRLNELECAEGWIYANLWQRDEIVRIDPDDGRVRAVIDASGLLAADERRRAGVLNGIAFDPDRQSFYLTGKNWDRLFEVVFVAESG